jgi:hypothetical protein
MKDHDDDNDNGDDYDNKTINSANMSMTIIMTMAKLIFWNKWDGRIHFSLQIAQNSGTYSESVKHHHALVNQPTLTHKWLPKVYLFF